jgi:hypothetical protein
MLAVAATSSCRTRSRERPASDSSLRGSLVIMRCDVSGDSAGASSLVMSLEL